jgi:hypothetical protein
VPILAKVSRILHNQNILHLYRSKNLASKIFGAFFGQILHFFRIQNFEDLDVKILPNLMSNFLSNLEKSGHLGHFGKMAIIFHY